MTEYKLPDEFWKCGEMYIEVFREKESLKGILNNLRKILKLSEGENITEAVEKLVNNRPDFIRELIVEPKNSYNYARTEREKICQELDQLGINYRNKSSTRDLQHKLEHQKTKSSKPPEKKQLQHLEW